MSKVAMKEEKVYKLLEPYLIEVNNECIAMEEDDTRSCVQVTLKVLGELIVKMKEANKLFEQLYNRITYVGSYFDGLRVKEATEFDINVVLKLPLVYEKIILKRPARYPGFVEVNLKDAKLPEEKLKHHQMETEDIFKWVSPGGLLSHDKVLRWWESIFSKLTGLSSLQVEGRKYEITKFKKAGPAMTAHISGHGLEIDVDLVPVIEFPSNIPPPQPVRREGGEWYIVPKRREDNLNLWRLSFSPQERNIMNGKNKLKVVNRFMKRLRDVNNWQPLSSYYIKSIFLWEAYLTKDPAFFSKNLGYLLVYFMGRLASYLDEKKIPFFWDKEMNLLEKIKPVTLEGYSARVKKWIDQLGKYCEENKTAEIAEMMKTLFHEKDPVNGGTKRIKSGNSSTDLLISFEESSSSAESASIDLPADLFSMSGQPTIGECSQTKLTDTLCSLKIVSPGGDSPSVSNPFPILHADSDVPSFSQRINQFDDTREKRMLELEECKLRLQIAELDLETAKFNLKAAEKRYEKANLECTMLVKANNL